MVQQLFELPADILIALTCICELKDVLRIEQVDTLPIWGASSCALKTNLRHGVDMSQATGSRINTPSLAGTPPSSRSTTST